MLGGARDEVPGGRHQPDPEPDGQDAEEHREPDPPAGDVRELEESSQPAHHAASSTPTEASALREPHDAIGIADEIRPMRDEEDRSARAQLLDRLADEARALPVEVRRRLVEDHEPRVAQERARQRDALTLTRRERAPALAENRPVSGRQLFDEPVGAGERGGGAYPCVVRRRVSEPDVVGRGGPKEGRSLRHPRDVRPPGRGVALRQIDGSHADPPFRGLEQPEEEAGERALAGAARSDEDDRLARVELEVDRVEHSALASRIRERHTLEADGLETWARRRLGAPARALVPSCEVEETARDGEPVRAGVELRGEASQRQVELGSQHEDRERRLEPDAALHEPHADGHRDERDAERRCELQDRARQERQPQRAHRGPAVLVAHPCDPLRLGLGAVERAERRQSTHHVEEVRGEEVQRPPAGVRAAGGRAPDQPHEDRDEGECEKHDPRREGVDPRDDADHGDRHDDRQHDLRQRPGQDRLQGVHSGDGRRRDLRALGAVERGGLVAQPPRHDGEPKLGEHVDRRAPADRLERPCRRGSPGRGRDEQRERDRDLRQIGAAESPRRYPGEKHGLREDEQRGGDRQADVDGQRDAHSPGAVQKATVEQSH